MPVQDWYKETIQEDTDGNYRGKGLWSAFLKNFVDEEAIEQGVQKSAVEGLVVNSGEDPTKITLGPRATKNQAQGQINTIQRDRAAQSKKTDFTNTMTATMAPIAAQLQTNNNQFKLQFEQMRNDRADAKDAKALELEYMRMRDNKDDRRYNESVERADRKDRQQSIQTLVAGLANLGAAFAI